MSLSSGSVVSYYSDIVYLSQYLSDSFFAINSTDELSTSDYGRLDLAVVLGLGLLETMQCEEYQNFMNLWPDCLAH
jgi:hypothetical protein